MDVSKEPPTEMETLGPKQPSKNEETPPQITEEKQDPEDEEDVESVGSFVYQNYKARNFLDFRETVSYL